MNPSDSKKLEEPKDVDDLQHYMEATSRLSAKVAEQAREIEAQLITYQAKIKEIDALEARIKELEQELLWAADACEKTETELVQLRKYNDVLQSQRADVYNEGVEDGKRQAESLRAKEEKNGVL